jgi:hypothetical protein
MENKFHVSNHQPVMITEDSEPIIQFPSFHIIYPWSLTRGSANTWRSAPESDGAPIPQASSVKNPTNSKIPFH